MALKALKVKAKEKVSGTKKITEASEDYGSASAMMAGVESKSEWRLIV